MINRDEMTQKSHANNLSSDDFFVFAIAPGHEMFLHL